MRVPNYTRQELCNEVYKAVMNAPQPLTRLEICRAIGRQKSAHIIDMIENLSAGGWLQREDSHDKFGRPAFRYVLAGQPDLDHACLNTIT